MDHAQRPTRDAAKQNAETVRWAYRLILGREPESESVIRAWAGVPPRETLMHFATSPEGAGNRLTGYPTRGAWMLEQLTPQMAIAAHQLRHGCVPNDEEIEAALVGHDDIAAFRAAFLASPEVAAAAAAPVAAAVTGADQSQQQEQGFSFFGQSFTLRGEGREEYWRSLVDGAPDSGVNRLARVALAAFPDGGAGRVLVDAGANIGLTTIAMATAAPYHAAILSIEPDERSTALLRHNLEANGLTEARVIEAALGAEDGVASMRRAGNNTATNYILSSGSRAPAANATAMTLDVPVRRLDTLLAEQGLDRLDLLKIDVEGGETEVMLGATQAIRRDRPIIFTEFNLWTQMTVAGRNPMDVLEEWHAAFPHFVVFDDAGNPLPIQNGDGLLWLLYAALTRRNGVDDLVLCHDLDWVERWV
ncbi:MAG: fkbM [Rubritepida sp.]|nr:fkbM [Rubritepida sp.]